MKQIFFFLFGILIGTLLMGVIMLRKYSLHKPEVARLIYITKPIEIWGDFVFDSSKLNGGKNMVFQKQNHFGKMELRGTTLVLTEPIRTQVYKVMYANR